MGSKLKKVTGTALIGVLFASASLNVHATGIPVVDVASIAEEIIQQINQLDQLSEMNRQTLQQVMQYRLTLQNLEQLPGDLRSQVQQTVFNQLINVVNDHGLSRLNDLVNIDPNSGDYYSNADTMIRETMGDAPMSADEFEQNLQSLGVNNEDATFLRHSANIERHQYRRILDDLRQVALNRKNSKNRSTIANTISRQMADLPANNTVGAIQLLSAQQSLKYAQDEDLLKTQNNIFKNMQEQQARIMSDRAAAQRKELERVQRALADDGVPYQGPGRR